VRIYDRRAALLVRLAAAIDGPSRQGAADPVDLLPSFVRLGVAVRLERGRLWLQPGLGAGALLLRVSAPSAIGAPTEIRALAALYADAVFAVRLWQGLSLCVELSLTGLPAIERYVVRPDGAQATSPYLRAAAQLGLQVDL
jgi:hypothetical protein